MRHKLALIAVLTVVVVFVIFILAPSPPREHPSLSILVNNLGTPTFLAKSTEVIRRKGKVLRVDVANQNPLSVPEWGSISNLVAVWVSSTHAKRRAMLFYDRLQKDSSFDGTAWISPSSLGGDKVHICEIDNNGRVTRLTAVNVVGISVRVGGAIPIEK